MAFFTANGSETTAYVIEVHEDNGDLVDLRYYCQYHAPRVGIAWNHWPAFDFGDSCIYCEEFAICGNLLNIGLDCDCDGEQHIIQTLVKGGWSESYAKEVLANLKARKES